MINNSNAITEAKYICKLLAFPRETQSNKNNGCFHYLLRRNFFVHTYRAIRPITIPLLVSKSTPIRRSSLTFEWTNTFIFKVTVYLIQTTSPSVGFLVVKFIHHTDASNTSSYNREETKHNELVVFVSADTKEAFV